MMWEVICTDGDGKHECSGIFDGEAIEAAEAFLAAQVARGKLAKMLPLSVEDFQESRRVK